MLTGYIRDPDEIYRQSFATIRAEADLTRFDAATAGIAIRMIHACGMVDLADDIVVSPGFAAAGRAALRAGAPIFCDAEMIRHGVIARLLPRENEVVCLIGEEAVSERARALGTTRSAAQVDFWADRLDGAVVAIGNAPTALFRLLEVIDAGGPRPAAVVAAPVGFVGAAESKAELVADPRGLPFIAVQGRRGGSAIASAAINALAGGLESYG
jgi:Precorrin isomerase